jgi:uncharacterized membrane protein YedE/YeeE
MLDFLTQPWSWYVAGIFIALVTFLLFYFGQHLGVSSNLETLCSVSGAGKLSDYFKIDWRSKKWNLTFVLGLIIGGFISAQWLTPDEYMGLNPKTVSELKEVGIADAGEHYLPDAFFASENLSDIKVLLVLLAGGFLVGFGARYAGGCTSGHGIVGLSSLQIPSFIAVAGFFIGGLFMTWVVMPWIFKFIMS